MNTTNGSIHPIIKALVAVFSLTMMSALVWYSHIQAQPKSPADQVAKQETAKSNATGTAQPNVGTLQLDGQPPIAITPSTKVSGMLLLPSSKSYTGLSPVMAGNLSASASSTNANSKVDVNTPPLPSIPSVPQTTDGTRLLKDQTLYSITPSVETSCKLYLSGSCKYYSGLSTVIEGTFNAPAKSSESNGGAAPSQTNTKVDVPTTPPLPSIPSVPQTSVDTINPRISIITVVDPSSTYESHHSPLASVTHYIYEPFKLSDPIAPLIKLHSEEPKPAAENPANPEPNKTVLMLGSKSIGLPVFVPKKENPQKQEVPKEVLMLGPKAPAMPVIPIEQKVTSPVEQPGQVQQKQKNAPVKKAAP